MKVRVWVEVREGGEKIVEIPDEDVRGLTGRDLDEAIEGEIELDINNMIGSGFEIIEGPAPEPKRRRR